MLGARIFWRANKANMLSHRGIQFKGKRDRTQHLGLTSEFAGHAWHAFEQAEWHSVWRGAYGESPLRLRMADRKAWLW